MAPVQARLEASWGLDSAALPLVEPAQHQPCVHRVEHSERPCRGIGVLVDAHAPEEQQHVPRARHLRPRSAQSAEVLDGVAVSLEGGDTAEGRDPRLCVEVVEVEEGLHRRVQRAPPRQVRVDRIPHRRRDRVEAGGRARAEAEGEEDGEDGGRGVGGLVGHDRELVRGQRHPDMHEQHRHVAVAVGEEVVRHAQRRPQHVLLHPPVCPKRNHAGESVIGSLVLLVPPEDLADAGLGTTRSEDEE
mmetsp:Transcript_35207/g.83620  ORF Transcript_35207/g.83620 Transcript_35207/m.83620 type:complete len:245 (+) Transcript_35207:171-905(+)